MTHPEQMTVLALKQSSVAGAYRFSYPTYEDLRDQTDSFSDVFAHALAGPRVMSGLVVGIKPTTP